MTPLGAVLTGTGFVTVGLITTRVAVGYFRGTGFRHSPAGTPAAGAGIGPFLIAIGLFAPLSSLPNSEAVSVVNALLLGVFVLGGAAGFVLLLTKPLLGWPSYGCLPHLLERNHRRRSLNGVDGGRGRAQR